MRTFNKAEQAELVNLHYDALKALPWGSSRYDRALWAAREWHKAHPDDSPTRAYKELDRLGCLDGAISLR